MTSEVIKEETSGETKGWHHIMNHSTSTGTYYIFTLHLQTFTLQSNGTFGGP